MPSHAPLCGINRPHARHWSRTNRIDPILELPPVTCDTVAVPPPTRSPEPKVTRYIVIRNDQHDGSSHQGKIFIVAGNRPAAVQLPGKQQLHSVTVQRIQALPPRVPRPSSRSGRGIIGLSRPAGSNERNAPSALGARLGSACDRVCVPDPSAANRPPMPPRRQACADRVHAARSRPRPADPNDHEDNFLT